MADAERIEALRIVVEDAKNAWFAHNIGVGYAEYPDELKRLSQAFKVLSEWLADLDRGPEPARSYEGPPPSIRRGPPRDPGGAAPHGGPA